MTEHCVNNGTSICQTVDATHLIITFKDFCASKTLGFTYSGKRCELEFYLVSDTKAQEHQLSLHVANNSADKWHILTYEDPMNNNTEATVKELPAKEDVYLYSIREFWFRKHDELVIFFRLDRDGEMLLSEEIDQEQLERLYRSLKSLQQDAQFADMTVNGASAHRAVLAAASHSLHQAVAELVSNKQGGTEISTDDNAKLTQATQETSHGSGKKRRKEETSHGSGKKRRKEKTSHGSGKKRIRSEKLLEAPDAADQESGLRDRDVKDSFKDMLLKRMSVAQSDKQLFETFHDMWDSHNSKQTDIEAMEHPLPDNYTMVIEEFRRKNNKHKESFLRYIYSGDVGISVRSIDLDSLFLSKNLIAVALQFNIRGLANAIESRIINYLHIDDENTIYLTEIYNLAAGYDLYNLLVSTMKVIRSSDLMSRNVNLDDPTFLKYYLSVRSNNHKHQQTCQYTFTVPNISRLGVKHVFSDVFYISGIPLRLGVKKYDEHLSIYLGLYDLTKSVVIKFSLTLLPEETTRRIGEFKIHNKQTPDWGLPKFIKWSELTDPERGFVVNDSVKIRAWVELIG